MHIADPKNGRKHAQHIVLLVSTQTDDVHRTGCLGEIRAIVDASYVKALAIGGVRICLRALEAKCFYSSDKQMQNANVNKRKKCAQQGTRKCLTSLLRRSCFGELVENVEVPFVFDLLNDTIFLEKVVGNVGTDWRALGVEVDF